MSGRTISVNLDGLTRQDIRARVERVFDEGIRDLIRERTTHLLLKAAFDIDLLDAINAFSFEQLIVQRDAAVAEVLRDFAESHGN